MEVLTMKLKPITTEVYDTYWKFAKKRQDVFFRKIENPSDSLINDEILKHYKFTNAYRAADRVSQFLIKDVIYKGAADNEDTLFRILLFKLFNKIETWQLLEFYLEEISWETFEFNKYDEVLQRAINHGGRIYNAAYIMPSGKRAFHNERKHRNHLRLIEFMMKDNLFGKIKDCKNLQEVFKTFMTYPSFGNFLSFQLTIDVNYSEITNFDENDFVVAGPGAINGIHKCFSDLKDYSYSDVIKYVKDRQNKEFDRLNLNFKTLWGRPLKLIDCQNLFCEVDKYSRVAHPEIKSKDQRNRIKRKYKPSNGQINYWFPTKWNINQKVKEFYNAIN